MGICKFGVLHRAYLIQRKIHEKRQDQKILDVIISSAQVLYELHITSMKVVELLARPDALSFQNAIHFDAAIRAKAIFLFMTSIYSVCT